MHLFRHSTRTLSQTLNIREVTMVLGSIRKPLEPLALTLLRLSSGIIMAAHGWDKLQDVSAWTKTLEAMQVPMPKIMAYLSIAGEFLGGLGLIVGLLTPLAAFGIFCVMAVAVFKVHWSNGLMAKNNGFEYPLTMMIVAFYFMMKGAGPISIDRLFCCKKDKTG